jgi:hypothetical protein
MTELPDATGMRRYLAPLRPKSRGEHDMTRSGNAVLHVDGQPLTQARLRAHLRGAIEATLVPALEQDEGARKGSSSPCRQALGTPFRPRSIGRAWEGRGYQ